MTCTLDEVVCAAFAVGAFAGVADLCVLLDTGSEDGTEELIRELYAEEIRDERLIVEQLGRLPDFDMSIARNRGLEIFRENDIDYFLKIDADDVFYDAGARHAVETLRCLPDYIILFCCRNYELYQWEVDGSADWLEAVRNGRDIFWEMSFRPLQERGFRVAGARARGKWGDEAATGHAEGINYGPDVSPEERMHTRAVWAAHYGWARPVERKREKIAAWYGDPERDPRVDRLHLIGDWRRPRMRFRRHPEVFARQLDKVIEWLRGR